MYIRKEIRNFMEKMPKEIKLPRHWRKFVNEYDKEYNLLIKHGKKYECTNCGKYFYSEQVEDCSDICPFCGGQYDVRRSNLKHYFFLYDLAFVDNIDNKLILRYFEVWRKYDYKTRRFKDDIVEYARIIPEWNIELVNDRFQKYLFSERVYHTKKIEKWRVFTGQNGLNQYYRGIYLENLDEKLKGTIYQYAPIEEAILYLGNQKNTFLNVLEKAKYQSFELLMKAGLYELATSCPEKFNEPGCFEKRFGVDKKFYEFMKRHNVNYKQLCVLRMINRPNIKIIENILRMAHNSITELETINTYVNLVKLEEYSKKQKNFSFYSYQDYIKNMQRLEIPLTRKVLFPENFEEAHDISVEKVRAIIKNKGLLSKKIEKRYKLLEKNKYSDNIFLIRPAKNLNDMQEESKQQHNCVYTNYSESYAFGDTDIYFLREMKKPNKSLVTVEVLDNKIRQKYQARNQIVTKEQDKFLKQWEKNIIQKAA